MSFRRSMTQGSSQWNPELKRIFLFVHFSIKFCSTDVVRTPFMLFSRRRSFCNEKVGVAIRSFRNFVLWQPRCICSHSKTEVEDPRCPMLSAQKVLLLCTGEVFLDCVSLVLYERCSHHKFGTTSQRPPLNYSSRSALELSAKSSLLRSGLQ